MRKEFPRRVKALAFKRCCNAAGLPFCEGCGAPLSAGNINFDHDVADGLGGEPTLDNCKVICRTCHSTKTQTQDNPIMQKADRVKKKTYGIAKSKQQMPGGRGTKWKKKMDGTVVKRYP